MMSVSDICNVGCMVCFLGGFLDIGTKLGKLLTNKDSPTELGRMDKPCNGDIGLDGVYTLRKYVQVGIQGR